MPPVHAHLEVSSSHMEFSGPHAPIVRMFEQVSPIRFTAIIAMEKYAVQCLLKDEVRFEFETEIMPPDLIEIIR